MPNWAAPPAAAAQPTGGIVLGRSPFERRIMVHGVIAGLVLALLTAAVGWPLIAATPISAELEAIDRVSVERLPLLVRVGWVLSYLGHAIPVTVMSLAVAIVARWRWRTWDFGLLLLVVFGGATSVTGVVKILAVRGRPNDALVGTLSSAFPSGHAVRAAAVYGLIAWLVLLVTRRRVFRVLVIVGAAGVIGLNALARVSLAAHWPSDVLVGVVVGTIWLVYTLHLLEPDRPPAARAGAEGETSAPDSQRRPG